jgi:hypothetical protein
MTISEFFKLYDDIKIDTRIAVKDVTGAHIFEGELHMFQSKFTRLFNIHNIISFRFIKDKDIWEFEIW